MYVLEKHLDVCSTVDAIQIRVCVLGKNILHSINYLQELRKREALSSTVLGELVHASVSITLLIYTILLLMTLIGHILPKHKWCW